MRTRSCARSVNKELLRLDDDSLAAVLAAVAEHYNQLSELASTCRRLCTLARGRVPFSAALLLGEDSPLLSTQGPPFCGCTELSLKLSVESPVSDLLLLLQRLVDWNVLHTLAVQCPGYGQVSMNSDHLLPGWDLLTSLRTLRSLTLTLPGVSSGAAAAIGRLTQLSHLAVTDTHFTEDALWGSSPEIAAAAEAAGAEPVDISPWAALSGLRRLEVTGIAPGPVGGSGGGASGAVTLPSGLQELRVCCTPWNAYWVQQLQGAAQLTKLEMSYCSYWTDHPSAHSVAVVQAAADHVPQLVTLQLLGNPGHKGWDRPLPLLPPAAEQAAPRTFCPGTALASLTHLVTLECMRSSPLHLTEAAHWDALCRLKQLTQLGWAHITVAPAAGQQLPALRRLGATVALTGAATAALLTEALPALEDVDVEMDLAGRGVQEQGAEQADAERLGQNLQQQHQHPQQQQQQPVPRGGALHTAHVNYETHQRDPEQAAPMAAHFAAWSPALSTATHLELRAAFTGEQGPCLPCLGPLTSLTELYMASYSEEDSVRTFDLLAMLQPVKHSLRRLTLDGFMRVSPTIVLALQHELAVLEVLRVDGEEKLAWQGDPRSEEELQEQLMRCVRPGLQLLITEDNVWEGA